MTTAQLFSNELDTLSHEVLTAQGFVVGTVSGLDRLLGLAHSLGTPIPMRRSGPLIDELIPQQATETHRNSLSSRHGKGAFPLHTDCAFWVKPPRFLVLNSPNEASAGAPTRLAQSDWLRESPTLMNRASTAIFKVVNGSRSFLSNILEPELVRFDRDCMIAGSPDSQSLIQEIESAMPNTRVCDLEWSPRLCVVIDNWRMLHGRASCELLNSQRVLRRILVMGGKRC